MADYIKLRQLHPTQITLGMREVIRRQGRFVTLDAKARKAYVDERVVPCVIGPKEISYLIDRHHMCRALLGAGVAEVRCDLVSDVSNLGEEEFWRFMDLRGWMHPFDATGRRCAVTAIPRSIEALVDDPYRALAGFVRRDNGFTKAATPFEEFIWADFLRHRIPAASIEKDFDGVCHKALELARSPAARHLPGWNGGRH